MIGSFLFQAFILWIFYVPCYRIFTNQPETARKSYVPVSVLLMIVSMAFR